MITSKERKHLIDSMSHLLDEYGYQHTDAALDKIINEWAAQKHNLLEAFKKHPNYVEGQFAIAFTCEFKRNIDRQGSRVFSEWLQNNCMKRLDIQRQNILDRRGRCRYLPSGLWDFFEYLNCYAERCISVNTAGVLKEAIPEVKVHVGEKTTRAVNRICTYLGWDKVEGYNKEFAKYADSLSDGTVKRLAVLSLNPMDYLTMSFGNSWSSCHTIDKNNKRNMPNGYRGMHASGTMSYMLDKPSMVFYTIDSNHKGTDYWQESKINRQMFHWGEDKLIQSRLYPQANDCSGNEYDYYRGIVQKIIAEIFYLSGDWNVDIGSYVAGGYVRSKGTHYDDYNCFDNCSLSYCGDKNEESFSIGADPICVRCGERHGDAEYLDHCVVRHCKHCGRIIADDEEVREIDGEIYCTHCVYWCDICQRYHVGNSTYIYGEGIRACDECLAKNFVSCTNCGRYVRINTDAESNGEILCARCTQRRADRRTFTYRSWLFDDL